MMEALDLIPSNPATKKKGSYCASLEGYIEPLGARPVQSNAY